MSAYAPGYLQRVRSLGQRFFLQFGLHCATHQIRIILISCVVITSLFYPALDLYTSSRNSSQSILDAILSPTSNSVENDLVNIWAAQDTIRMHEDPVTRAKCRNNNALRVERIFIQSPIVEEDAALNHQILLSTFDLEQRLQDGPCLKTPSGKCLVVSPLAFWDYDQELLRTDKNILDTLNTQFKNVSIAGIPITPQMVLAGRGSYEHHVGGNSKFDYANFLALTYFFPESSCWNSEAEHSQWIQTVERAIAHDAGITPHVSEATLIALEYDPHRSDSSKGWSAISAFLYLAYIGFFAYVVWSVRRMDTVHSRLGVTFTALVEIAVSTITSLSVCALVGFKITMVPWELLPIVIVFVGAENMFNLVDAVGKTSVTLSVKQRIAEGLSRAGTSNTLKVVSYNAILGVIAVFAVGAVRQFCIFAIVVLVAHWFLAHTFFMAVLSIDIARLELEELLRHDATLAPTVPAYRKERSPAKQPRSGWQKLMFATQNLLKGRATTNLSLLMLLAIAATLYYTTYTASISPKQNALPKSLGAVSRTKARPVVDIISPAERIWKTLNPVQTPLLHLRIEAPTIITFSAGADSTGGTGVLLPSSPRGSRYPMRTFRFVLWLLTILVLPIAATTSALWGLLLYLMKNTELLEAQRHRPDAEGSQAAEDEQKSLESEIAFSTLPRAFMSDVDLIAVSKDGKTVVSVGLRNEITVWNSDRRKHVAIDAGNVLLRMASTSSCAASTVTAVTVDDTGRYFAVGTGAGLIAAWGVDKVGSVKPLPLLSLENSSTGVTGMQFVPPVPQHTVKKPGRTPPLSEPDSLELFSSRNAILLATYENGFAARWVLAALPTVAYFSSSRNIPVIRTLLVNVAPENRVLVGFCLEDGGLDLVETGDYQLTILEDCCIQPGQPMDVVTQVHACRAELNGSLRLVIAAATEAGVVSLWDGRTAECISLLDEAYGPINSLLVSPVKCESCHFCGHLPMESLALAFSVPDTIVHFLKLYIEDQTRRCSCGRGNQQHQLHGVSSRESLGRRSRSNSNSTTSSRTSSPLIPRARLATAFETSAFPVSGHGVHSRRASEKDTTRRSSELLTVPFPGNLTGDEYDGGGSSSDHSGTTTPTSGAHSVWRNAVLAPIAQVKCERGGWDMVNGVFVGVGRIPRAQIKVKSRMSLLEATRGGSSGGVGLTTSTMERWEIWTFDPATTVVKSSLLSGLPREASDMESSSAPSSRRSSSSSSASSTSSGIPRLPFTRVSPLLTTSTLVLAGFGNTIGIFYFISR